MAKKKLEDDDTKKEWNSKYVAVAEMFRDELKGEGRQLLSASNVLYVYQDGFWSIVDTYHYDELEPLLLGCTTRSGIEFGDKHKPLWKVITTMSMAPGARFDDVPLIAMPEGTLDVQPDAPEVVPHDAEHMIMRRVAIQYKEGAECPEWEAMLRRMLAHPDRTEKDVEDIARFLQQWVGINIVGPKAKTNRALQKGLLIEGASHTGKTTFAEVVRELFGATRVVSVNMADLGSEYGKAPLINAQALITDDGIEGKKAADPRVLKAIVTGEQMTVNRKFKDHISFRFRGAVLFTTNTLPNFQDESDAIYNRFVLVRMDHVFTKEEQRAQLKGMDPVAFLKKKKEFPGILNWAIQGFRDAYDNQGFVLPAEIREASDVFRARNDPVFAFTKECVKPGKKNMAAIAVTAMAQEYALAVHNMARISPKTIHAQMQRVIREVYPTVALETEGSVRNVVGYDNVELTPLGLAYWSKVKEKGVAGLESLSTPYGKRV